MEQLSDDIWDQFLGALNYDLATICRVVCTTPTMHRRLKQQLKCVRVTTSKPKCGNILGSMLQSFNNLQRADIRVAGYLVVSQIMNLLQTSQITALTISHGYCVAGLYASPKIPATLRELHTDAEWVLVNLPPQLQVLDAKNSELVQTGPLPETLAHIRVSGANPHLDYSRVEKLRAYSNITRDKDMFGGKVPANILEYEASCDFFNVVSDERAQQFDVVHFYHPNVEAKITRDMIKCRRGLAQILAKFGPRPRIVISENSAICNKLQTEYTIMNGASIYWDVKYTNDDPVIHPSTMAVDCKFDRIQEHTFFRNLRKMTMWTRNFAGFPALMPNLDVLDMTATSVAPQVDVAIFAPNLSVLKIRRYGLAHAVAIHTQGLRSLKELMLDGVDIGGELPNIVRFVYFPYKATMKPLAGIKLQHFEFKIYQISAAILLAMPRAEKVVIEYISAAKDDYKAIAARCSLAVRDCLKELFE